MALEGYKMHGVKMIKKGEILSLLNSGKLRRKVAAENLGISLKPLDRIDARWRKEGFAELVHRSYGHRSNRGRVQG